MIEVKMPASAAAPIKRRFRRVYVVIAGVLLLLSVTAWKMWQNSLGQVSSGQAPDFTLTTFDGQTLQLSRLAGKAVMVNFWASWCVPCRQVAPVLQQAWQDYHDRGVVFVGVDYLDDERPARQFMTEYGITYPNGPDLGTRISSQYRVKGVPETFFIDRSGAVQSIYIGPMPEADLRQRLETLLQN